MSLESIPNQNGIKATSPVPDSKWGRFVYFMLITILPILCFWFVRILEPEWRSGKFSDYLALSLLPESSLLFIFLLLYSIISYMLLMRDVSHYSQSFIVRLGIYTGVLLAFQYSVAVFAYSIKALFFILTPIWFFPIVLPLVSRWARRKWDAWKINIALTVFLIGVFIAFSLYWDDISMFPFMILIGLLIAAPFYSFLIALQAAIWLFKNHEAKLTPLRGFRLLAWLAVYIAAWRYDILKMYELYAALPPQPPPDCYIATAATRGHSQFVGSRTIRRADGMSMQVNGQLQLLKCAELALMAVNPRLHKFLRKIYDVVGKPLAQKIQNPFFADIAYIFLKPVEWVAGLTLKIIIPEIEKISKRMYIS